MWETNIADNGFAENKVFEEIKTSECVSPFFLFLVQKIVSSDIS